MSLVTGSISDILSIKIKQRHDSYSDQYSRILMVKILVICALITSVEFYNDKVSCILPKDLEPSAEFVQSACWIQGFYIYQELLGHPDESGYYGLPFDISDDGIRNDGKLCRIQDRRPYDPQCNPLTKMYFNQYQYFPFFIATLAVLYYFPYILFRIANGDMISLKSDVDSLPGGKDATKIAETYFNHANNGGLRVLRIRVWANIAVKLIYMLVNFGSFLSTDKVLNRRYTSFGFQWMKWSRLNNTMAYDYSGLRGFPKPGNYLLPSLGYCDIVEGVKSKVHFRKNEYSFVCEISTNILYQYVLVVMWFLFISGMLVSSCGFIYVLVTNLCMSCRIAIFDRQGKLSFHRCDKHLSVREIEYLYFIRGRNIYLYKDVNHMLQGEQV